MGIAGECIRFNRLAMVRGYYNFSQAVPAGTTVANLPSGWETTSNKVFFINCVDLTDNKAYSLTLQGGDVKTGDFAFPAHYFTMVGYWIISE